MPTLETVPTPSYTALMLQQTRVIRASRTRVYEAWTNAEVLKKWFGPANMHCTSAALDVRVGGAYRIDITGDAPTPSATPRPECEQRRSAALGTYTRVVPNELLQFTWSPDWNLGEESLVTVSFKDVREGTEVTILHERFNTEVSRDGHNKGWAGSLDKLAETFQRQ